MSCVNPVGRLASNKLAGQLHWRRTSSGPFARGTVTAIAPIIPNSPMLLAKVSWADGVTTQVNVPNLEIQPGNPPLTPR